MALLTKLSARFGWPSLGNGRAIVVPESVTGKVDGKAVTLNTRNNWFSYQGNVTVQDDERIRVFVGDVVHSVPLGADAGRCGLRPPRTETRHYS